MGGVVATWCFPAIPCSSVAVTGWSRRGGHVRRGEAPCAGLHVGLVRTGPRLLWPKAEHPFEIQGLL